jgi:hypothetical protein
MTVRFTQHVRFTHHTRRRIGEFIVGYDTDGQNVRLSSDGGVLIELASGEYFKDIAVKGSIAPWARPDTLDRSL